jgi:hypothetical protein
MCLSAIINEINEIKNELTVFVLSIFFSFVYNADNKKELLLEHPKGFLAWVWTKVLLSGLFGVVIYRYLLETKGFGIITNISFSTFGSLFFYFFVTILKKRVEKNG